MRGVRDELAPRVVELGEPDPHPLERDGEVAELVAAAVPHRLVEIAARNPVRRTLEPANTAGKDPCAAVAEQQRKYEPDAGGQKHAPLNEVDAAELTLERVP